MNEITVGLFQGLGLVLIILVFYTLIRNALLTSLLSVIIAYVMAQYILNGNVVSIVIINDVVTYLPMQSLPIHYLLLGIAVIMTIMTFYLLLMIINARIETMGQDNEIQRWSE